MKTILRTVALVLLLVGLTGCQTAKPEAKAPSVAITNSAPLPVPLAITHGPFLQAPSETGVTISWATSRKCVSWVEHRPESAKDWRTNAPVQHGLVAADVIYHNVTLRDLQPGTRYVYRVVSREITDFKFYRVTYGGMVISAEHRFTTFNPRKPATSFVVLNDRHEKIAPLMASLASVKWTNVDLAFLNGDMVHGINSEPQIFDCVIDPCTLSFARTIPLVYVRGNHDARGSFARRLLDYFPTDSGRYYYTLQQGPAAFLVLDCGEDKGDGNVEYYGLVDFEPYMREQAQWLAKAIQAPAFQQAQYRICLLHMPPSQKADPKFIRPKWLMDHVAPLLNQGKVDLLISGHTHKYAVQPAGTYGLNFPMIVGGTETVIRCDVSAKQIKVTATDLSGKPLPQLAPIPPRAKE